MVAGPERWRNKGGRGSMLLSSTFTPSLPGCQHTSLNSWTWTWGNHEMLSVRSWALTPCYVGVELGSVRTLVWRVGTHAAEQRELLGVGACLPDGCAWSRLSCHICRAIARGATKVTRTQSHSLERHTLKTWVLTLGLALHVSQYSWAEEPVSTPFSEHKDIVWEIEHVFGAERCDKW